MLTVLKMEGFIFKQHVVHHENILFPTPPVKPVLMAFTKSYDRPFEDLEKVFMLLQQKIFVGYVVTLKV